MPQLTINNSIPTNNSKRVIPARIIHFLINYKARNTKMSRQTQKGSDKIATEEIREEMNSDDSNTPHKSI